MRRLLPVLLICALAPLAAACGAEDDVTSAVDPVAQAATKTQNAGTVEVAMTGKVSAAGQEIPLKGEGAFDLKGKRGHVTVTTSVPGKGDVEIEEIIDGLVLYMRSDAFASGLPGGKKWLKIDLKEAGKKTGVDLAQLQQLSGGSSDPTQFLTYLSKAGDVKKVGSEDINGTPTTRYHATIDFDKLAGSAGDAASSVRQLEKLSGLKELPTDIWIDGDQRVRRQTVSIAIKQPVPTKFDLTIDYKRFGVPVDTTAPPADETADFSDITGG
jgi:hypothetical protein